MDYPSGTLMPTTNSHTVFLSHKYSRGSPHCWYINLNKVNCTEKKGERERTTVYKAVQPAATLSGQEKRSSG